MTRDKVFYEWALVKKGITKKEIELLPLRDTIKLQELYINWLRRDFK